MYLCTLQDQNDRGENEVTLLVHQSTVGAIIGRGGAKIKEMRDVSLFFCFSFAQSLLF